MQIMMFKQSFHSQYQWFNLLIKQIKNDDSHGER